MRKNFGEVVEAFLAGKACRGSASCSTDGDTIYSYALPIARRMRKGKISSGVQILEYDRAPSATTRSQVGALRTYFHTHFSGIIPIEWVEKVEAK